MDMNEIGVKLTLDALEINLNDYFTCKYSTYLAKQIGINIGESFCWGINGNIAPRHATGPHDTNFVDTYNSIKSNERAKNVNPEFDDTINWKLSNKSIENILKKNMI